MKKNSLVQAVILIAAAAVLAIVTNGFAGRERKLNLPGWWPNATKVPAPVSAAPPPPVVAQTTTTTPAVTTAAPTATTTGAAPVSDRPPVPVPVPPPAQDRPEGGAAPVTQPVQPKPDASRFLPHPDKAYVEIAGEDVAALHAAGALFLDARRTSVFEDGHIAGARSFSVWESDIDDKVNALFAERSDPESQAKPIVIYCSGGACEDSHMLAQKLWGIQFNNVYVYKDGYPDWQKRGGATRSGPNP